MLRDLEQSFFREHNRLFWQLFLEREVLAHPLPPPASSGRCMVGINERSEPKIPEAIDSFIYLIAKVIYSVILSFS